MSERAREIAHAEYLADPTHTHVDYPKMRCRACRDRDCLAETIQSALEEATAGVEKELILLRHLADVVQQREDWPLKEIDEGVPSEQIEAKAFALDDAVRDALAAIKEQA